MGSLPGQRNTAVAGTGPQFKHAQPRAWSKQTKIGFGREVLSAVIDHIEGQGVLLEVASGVGISCAAIGFDSRWASVVVHTASFLFKEARWARESRPSCSKPKKGMVMSPENGIQRIFGMSHKQLLGLRRAARVPVSFEESIVQIRAADPRPVWVPAEISNAHIPTGKLKVYYTCPGSLLIDEPIGGAVVSMTRNWAFAFKRWYQVVSRPERSQFIRIDVSSLNGTLDLVAEPPGNVFTGVLGRSLGEGSIAQAGTKTLTRPQVVEGHQCRAGCSPDGPLLDGKQPRMRRGLSGQFRDDQGKRSFVAHGKQPWGKVAESASPVLVGVDFLSPVGLRLVDLEIAEPSRGAETTGRRFMAAVSVTAVSHHVDRPQYGGTPGKCFGQFGAGCPSHLMAAVLKVPWCSVVMQTIQPSA